MSHLDPTPTPLLDQPGELQPTRLVLTSTPGSTVLEGVWWPRSDSLHREVPFLDLAVHAAARARIARLSYTVGAWDDDATRIWTPLGMVKVGWFITSLHPRDVTLGLTDHRRVVLHVISSETPAAQGEASLRQAEESRTAVAHHAGPQDCGPDPAPGPEDGSRAVRRVGLLVDPVERALAANRLQRSFERGAAEAARMRQEALRAAREDLSADQLADALRVPVSRVHALLASADPAGDEPWGR